MNFYFDAAKVLDRLDARQGSIKGIIASLPEKDRSRTAALVIETLKFKTVLVDTIEKSKLMKQERKLSSLNLALVLVHDLLLARGIQAGDGPIKQAILRHKARLNGEFQKIKIHRGVSSNAALANDGDERAALIPRYVRVNTLLTTLGDAIHTLVAQGFHNQGHLVTSGKSFSRDEHIPNLLLFPPKTSFHGNPLYTSGKVILQDKASCFPATVLAPPSLDTAVVIDATAAPGNKTSHLSALMENRGKLYALERDPKRFATLKNMLSRAGCSNVIPINSDFLTVDPLDPRFEAATHILLDPSCSGSGIVNRLDHLLDEGSENDSVDEDRLVKLAAFQLLMIRHAMRFPNVKKIVYSTCSVHATENEHVVRDALQSEEASIGRFMLAPQNEVLPQWHRRGYSAEMSYPSDAQCIVRALPGEDATNGFFVSCFVRSPMKPGQRDSTPKRKIASTSPWSEPRPRKKRKCRVGGAEKAT